MGGRGLVQNLLWLVITVGGSLCVAATVRLKRQLLAVRADLQPGFLRSFPPKMAVFQGGADRSRTPRTGVLGGARRGHVTAWLGPELFCVAALETLEWLAST